jgi:hypothetical protein
MKLLRRNVGRWAVLGIVFTAIVMAATPDTDVAANVVRTKLQVQGKAAPVRTPHASQRPAGALHVELERLARSQSEQEARIGGIFNATSWYEPPPPPPPPPPAPPPVPTAPPLPFTYLGRYEDAPTKVVILTKGERIYTVSEGEVIENTYRVERVTSGTVDLIYLPLNTRQALSTGGAL